MPVVEMEGHPRIMLASNNYLGLTGDERVMQGARDALARYGTGLTGSRLLNGTTPLHLELERELAEWMGTEDALVFTTGHQANMGALGTLLDSGDTVIVDSGDHASILDGVLLSRAKMRPFRHSRMDKLERALTRAEDDGGGVLVVVDGVFSMEGDVAPLVDIAELCARYGARLMVDEAHAAGVLGARGAGAAELLGVEDAVDLRMGTFSKSLAACGGFLVGDAEVIDYLRISSRAFLFTASAVPAALGAALAALRVVRSSEGPQLLEAVLENAHYFAAGLDALGYRVLGGEPVRMGPSEDAGVGGDPHADHPDPHRRRLEGGTAVAGPVRRGRVHQLRAAPGGAPGRRAAAHQRDGDARPRDARPRARGVRSGQARVRDRARTAVRARRELSRSGAHRRGRRPPASPSRSSRSCDLSISSQVPTATKKVASSVRSPRARG